MNKKQFHILNGDALKDRFPIEIEGEVIVMRKCLVEGNVKGENLEEIFLTRAKFIHDHYYQSKSDYFKKVVPEIKKIRDISEEAEINLWFEDDLFCQVNLWFVIYLLNISGKRNDSFLIRPITHTQFGFGNLTNTGLLSLYKNRRFLMYREKLAKLWTFYQNDDQKRLLEIAKELRDPYPFILPAVRAHIARTPKDGKPGRHYQSLIEIMNELKTDQFDIVFSEFCKRESIYGFGDIQVKRLIDDIQDDSNFDARI